MALKKLAAADVGLPRFGVPADTDGETFALSSHQRAREALEFGLPVADPGFNIFVLGEDHSGRMTATLEFLETVVAKRPPPDDWVYLNNFRRPHRPKPYRLPPGVGRRFRDRMADLVPQLREALAGAFGSEDYLDRVRVEREKVQAEASARMDALRAEMQNHGLEIAQDTEGMMSVRAQAAGDPPAVAPPARDEAEPISRKIDAFTEELRGINRWAVHRHAEFSEKIEDLDQHVGDMAIGPLMDEVIGGFAAFGALVRWLTAMRVDIVESLGRFRPLPPESGGEDGVPAEAPERYYAVNLFVDHADDDHPSVVLEANPTYENIFGRMEYRQLDGVLETDFTLIRSGSIHRANGGVLVLRADAIARNAVVWEALKGALRDREVALEELERPGALPVAGAPRAKPVPLEVKVVIVGAPHWYYTFFSVDSEFRAHFRVKADIDGEMDATDANLANYAGLIRGVARDLGAAELAPAAVGRLLAAASRLAAHREKLSARFELIASLVSEARALTFDDTGEAGDAIGAIDEDTVARAIANRRRRNARVEDRLHENIARGIVMIDTNGAVIGQINALTVRDLGDHAFGTPARVTARASVGRLGVTNIEREVAIGGPIQQKGVMVLQGFLAGHFARRFPLSFNCSITFEQSYGGVEGDSASVAELLAIISDLAGLACRQDLAVTGSVNQRGQVQAVAGVAEKVEGFFRSCRDAGPLTGTQGVVLPAANEPNLVLEDAVADAIEDGSFHLWSVSAVEDALEIFTGVPAGVPHADGTYPAETVYGRAMRQLEEFDRALADRVRG
ncbi:MAG: AAA family ATPase [Rhodospirillales bacterium]|jgi:predicted ATP-dependent protease|nr:AAA family ATPase [Rhodospirillales bacterium]